MTERVPPLSRKEYDSINDAPHYVDGWQIMAAQADRLLDIAEDHAQLHAENAKLRERVANLMVAIAPLRIDSPCKCDNDGECQYHAEMLHEVVLAARAALAACDEEP